MRRLLPLIALIAVAAFSGAFGYAVATRTVQPSPEPVVVTARGDLADDEAATISLFEAAQGSVAFIATTSAMRDPWRRRSYDVPRGSGSGFVWDTAGHVVTNAHVIENASGATVRLASGEAYEAELVGASRDHDLAVLRIRTGATAVRPLPVGTSGDLRVGQSVFAIGNPFGLDFTLTTGVVSALERELPGEGGIVIRGLVQTDAAINPGNSGGPLLDSAGRLVGVNTAIYSPSGASAGIGFAVPVDTVMRVVPQLIERGRYAPPVIGVVADPRADALLQRQGGSGVLILDVERGSPAEAAGLQPARMDDAGRLIPGDVIVGMDGEAIGDIEELRRRLDSRAAGDDVALTVARQNDRRDVTLTLARGAG